MEQSIALDRDHANAQAITTMDEPIEKKEVECVKPNACDQQEDLRDDEEKIDDILRNSDNNPPACVEDDEEQQQQQQQQIMRASLNHGDSAVRNCPMCDWEFPEEMNDEGKRQHIEGHFQ